MCDAWYCRYWERYSNSVMRSIEKGTVHVIRGNAGIGKGTLYVCNVLGKVVYA